MPRGAFAAIYLDAFSHAGMAVSRLKHGFNRSSLPPGRRNRFHQAWRSIFVIERRRTGTVVSIVQTAMEKK
jgi:hypothetical protein